MKVVEALDDAMRLLADNPGIGHLRSDLTHHAIRFWPVFRYLVIDRPDTSPLQIIRVLHGRRDVKQLLQE